MTIEQENKLKEMLSSNNEDDINLAGSIIRGLPNEDYNKLRNYLVDKFGDEHEEVLNSEYRHGLTEKKLNRWLTSIYKKHQTPTEQVIMMGEDTYERFEQELKDQTSLLIKTDPEGVQIYHYKTNDKSVNGNVFHVTKNFIDNNGLNKVSKMFTE